jgi:hypothetical protein
VLIAWHVEKGGFGDVALTGLNVAFAIHSPGPMTQVKWSAAVYLDAKASPPQKDALLKIFSGQAGGHPAMLASFVGKILGVKDTSIEYKAEGKRRSLRIPYIADVEIEGMTGQGDGEVRIEGAPVCVAPGYRSTVATSKRFSYQDHGLKWEISGKNGFYSPFSYQGA